MISQKLVPSIYVKLGLFVIWSFISAVLLSSPELNLETNTNKRIMRTPNVEK